MIVIKMIMRVTGFNQEQLANYLGVSRASVNSWVNSEEEMTTYQKHIVSNKFDIPLEYLDIDFNADIEVYKKLYSIIDTSWNKQKNISSISKEDELLNLVEYQLKGNKEETQLTDNEILNGLCEGYNPFTGEILDDDNLLNNIQIKTFLNEVRNKYYKYGVDLTKYDLNTEQRRLFEELRSWRMEKTIEEEFFSAYMVFNDKELINILTAQVNKKEDLKNIKGIGKIKYEKYGDDLFDILSKFKRNNNGI